MATRNVVIVLASLCAVRSLFASAPDHLVPPYQDRDWGIRGYASLLEKKLFLTSASYGRILVCPSAGSLGEYSLSLYPSSRPGLASVTYVRASRNVWFYLSDQLHGRPHSTVHEAWEEAPLRFSRSDVTLPASTGAALRAAVAAMLRGARGKYPGTTRVIVDGYDIEFSLLDGRKTMTGAITAGLSGKNISELEKLVDLLKTYCEVSPTRQASLATEIERKAKRVATRANEI